MMKRLLILAIAAAVMTGCNQTTQTSQTSTASPQASSPAAQQTNIQAWAEGTWTSERGGGFNAGAKVVISRDGNLTIPGYSRPITEKYHWLGTSNKLQAGGNTYVVEQLSDGKMRFGQADNDGQNPIYHRG